MLWGRRLLRHPHRLKFGIAWWLFICALALSTYARDRATSAREVSIQAAILQYHPNDHMIYDYRFNWRGVAIVGHSNSPEDLQVGETATAYVDARYPQINSLTDFEDQAAGERIGLLLMSIGGPITVFLIRLLTMIQDARARKTGATN